MSRVQAAATPHVGWVRYFVALRLTAAAVSKVVAIRTNFGVCRNLVAPSRLHMTLCITDDYFGHRVDLVSAHIEALARILLPSCEVVLGQLVGTASRTLLQPGRSLADLHELQEVIADHLRAHGVPLRRETPFSPHVTIAHDNVVRAQTPIEPISWRPAEVVLVESRIGKTEDWLLGSWPLTDVGPRQGSLL